jgi:tRNA-(ms[2]io[6]A)-hydroxylase
MSRARSDSTPHLSSAASGGSAARALARTLEAVPLASRSGDPWLAVALADLSALLDDHCQCELKAAANALSLVARHPGRDALVARMSSLAKEEMHHYRIVRHHLRSRGGVPSRPVANPYVQALGRGGLGGEQALLDDLLTAALVEARSCERFVVLAEAMAHDPRPSELASLYERLARSESGHAKLFLDLAREAYGSDMVEEELGRRVQREAEILASLPATARMHGGMAPPV